MTTIEINDYVFEIYLNYLNYILNKLFKLYLKYILNHSKYY